jgi:two-component system, LytTR family, sensor kinase
MAERESIERPLAVKLLWLSLVWVAIGTVFSVQLVFLGMDSAGNAFRFALLDWGPWIAISPVVLWFSRRVQIGSGTWRWALPAHLVACCAVAVVLELGNHWAIENNWFGLRPPQRLAPPGSPATRPPEPRPESAAMRQLMRARLTIPIYWVLVAAAHAVAYHRRSLDRERRALQAEARLAEARLATLQAQLNPHFLFNTLNAIALYVHESPAAAEEMIESLSEMLRVVMAAAHRREVPLLEELAFVDRYLAIQRVRFADRLTVQHEIAPDAHTALVPTLLLQPLVENAVIHGVAPESVPGRVFLRARVAAGRLHLEIVDTGHGKAAARPANQPLVVREGLGLGNTRARLQALYGDDFHFSLVAAPEGGVCARIEIPLRTAVA